MKRKFVKILSVIVCLAILLGTVPMSAFADAATETTTVSGEINWVSRDRQSSGSRPTSVQLTLYANGVATDYAATVTKPSGNGYYTDPNAAWSYEFADVPTYDENGSLIVYTVKQAALSNYETMQDSSTLKITNSYIGGMSTSDNVSHLDVRIDGAVLDVKFVIKDALGNIVDEDYQKIKASVTAVKSFNLNNVYSRYGLGSYTYAGSEFQKSGTHEFRKLNMNFYLTEQTTAEFVVDLVDEHRNVFENVKVSCGLGAIMAAAYECDGYNDYGYGNNKIDGLDFIVGAVSNFKIEVVSIGLEIDIEKQIQRGDETPVSFKGKGDEFTFQIKEYEVGEDGSKKPTNKQAPKVVYQDGKWVGLVYYTYSSIQDLEDYKGKTFLYEVSEVKGSNGIYTYDETVYEFTVQFELQKTEHTENGGFDEVLAPVIQEEAYKDHTFVFVNKIETVEVSGSKTWDDDGNRDGIRPESITVYLLANGEQVNSATVTAANGWAWTFAGLNKYDANGDEIVYTISEAPVRGYTSDVQGSNLINAHVPEKVTVSGKKTWDDANNQDGIRPEKITIKLLANGTVVDTKVVTEADGWAWEFINVPKYAAGEEIVYTVQEEAVAGYSVECNGMNITNTHTPAVKNITVEKIWDDADDQDGMRPDKITVKLLADGAVIDTVEVTAQNGWKYEWKDLAVNKAGQAIEYTVEEVAVPGYETDVDGFVIVNTHVPEMTEVNGTKTWLDADNQDGIRPESITIRLWANGTEVESKTVSARENWAWSFANLPAYADGVKIVYTVTEDAVEGYESVIEGFDITNTHEPEKTQVFGSKVWDDADNQDGIRPQSVTINLLKNGEKIASAVVSEETQWKFVFDDLDKFAAGEEIVYTINEEMVSGYENRITGNAADGFVVTNFHTPEETEVTVSKQWEDADNQDGIRPESITIKLYGNGELIATKTVKESDEWVCTFENLPKFAAGEEIVYTITENEVEGYTTQIDGFVVINTHIPEVIDISGSKTWDDADDQDGIRPESITINLYGNDELVTSLNVTVEDEWTWTFAELPKYENGVEIVYKITEDKVEGYTSAINGFDVTNTHMPDTTDITVQKEWNDNDNQDGIRPEKITVQLYADGEAFGLPVELTGDAWSYTWEDLPVNMGGEEIQYTVQEVNVPEGYVPGVNDFVITNTHNPEMIEISGNKTWVDDNDRDGIRPESITIRLWADGVEVRSKIANAENEWSWTFVDLPKYADGKEIVYTITEDKVEGYETVVNGFNVTNTHETEKVTVSGGKTWNDANNQDGKRPESITINLFANGEKIASKVVTAEDEWKWSFADLNKYAAGQEIAYTITEEDVEGYESKVENFDVTNTHEVSKITIGVSKVWKDDDNKAGLRADSVTVILLADGKETEHKLVLNAAGQWKGVFENLDEYANGEKITYTVKELKVDNYAAEITGDAAEGFVVTNTLTVIPPTGDSSLIGAFVVVMVLSFTLLAVLVVNKKRFFA